MTKYEPRKSVKLSDSDVVEILRLYHEERWTQGALARKFNVSAGTIGRYVRGESRQDVVAEPLDGVLTPIPAAMPSAELLESMARLKSLIDIPAAPEEDHLDEMMRRRSAAASTAAEAAREIHKGAERQENESEADPKV
jgi:DNA-binding transcriptional regulator LsrR (DeoR family)